MKLKKYLFSLLIVSSAFTFAGCVDFLDRSPLGDFTEDDAPGGSLDGQVFGLYTQMRSYNITAGIPAFAIHNFRSEDSEKGSSLGDGEDQAAMFDDFFYTTNNGVVSAYWGQNYTIIYQCNSVIDVVDKGDMTDEGSQMNKGEALFFRAYAYFNLVRAFGEVPLVTFRVNDASEANIAKTTVDKVYEQIDADLKAAEELLPEKWSSTYIGRLTRSAARALHARTYMMRSDWTNMYAAANDVMNTGLYNLNTPYDKIFTDEGENTGESVFELQCTATAAQPSSSAIGSQFCEVQGIRGSGEWDLGWGWHMASTEMGKAYENGDPRKDATLLYFRKSNDEPITPANTNKPYGESPVSNGAGTYFNKKAYTDPAKRKEFSVGGYWVNIRLIRYADVVLMAAEAANELGNASAAQSNLEMVRARARGANEAILPRITATDQNTLRDAIRHERRVELGLEFDRFYDLVRWGIAEQVLHAAGKTNYQNKNRYLPLPQDEIDKSNGMLVQNSNY